MPRIVEELSPGSADEVTEVVRIRVSGQKAMSENEVNSVQAPRAPPCMR
jgi:hypothetical protein